MSSDQFDELPDPAWHLKALEEDRGVLTKRILMFLLELEGHGYSPETIGRVLGPIFGLYIRDHYRGNPRFGTGESISKRLPATMSPELIEELAMSLGYSKEGSPERLPKDPA